MLESSPLLYSVAAQLLLDRLQNSLLQHSHAGVSEVSNQLKLTALVAAVLKGQLYRLLKDGKLILYKIPKLQQSTWFSAVNMKSYINIDWLNAKLKLS